MKSIYIFYALIIEEKSKELKMHGPFIHHRPEVEKIGWPEYVFDKNDYRDERKFLSKWLRTKHTNKLSIFHSIDIENPHIKFKCPCGHVTEMHIEQCNNDFICESCNTNDGLESLIKIGDDHRQSLLLRAYGYFDKHFSQMSENYNICNRKKR